MTAEAALVWGVPLKNRVFYIVLGIVLAPFSVVIFISMFLGVFSLAELPLALLGPGLNIGLLARSVPHEWARRIQQRSKRVDRAQVCAVFVRVAFVPRSLRHTQIWLEVFDRSTGAPLGWLRCPRMTPSFQPQGIAWLSGAGDPSGIRCLESEDRAIHLYPLSHLVSSPPPVADWSAGVAQLLGWGVLTEVPVGELPATLPAAGRIAVGGSGKAAVTIAALAIPRYRATIALGGFLLVMLVVFVVGVVLSFIYNLWALIAAGVIVFVVNRFWERRYLLPVGVAAATLDPSLPRDSVEVSRIVHNHLPPVPPKGTEEQGEPDRPMDPSRMSPF